MGDEHRQSLIDRVVTALIAAPSDSDMAHSTQNGMTEISDLLLAETSYLVAGKSDADIEAFNQLPFTASDQVRRFAATWYFAGLTRGVATTIAATESRQFE